MVKKIKENEPQQKERLGKCTSLNATTFLLLCNKQLCAACHLCHNSWIVKLFKLG